ncbi:hypothetical protein [Halorussus halophilus]|uniref:hypothetical protein n=1 Tax=Halorussus halophilus TaxID=2650975 RepID=UPI001CE46AD9|nr:hypothetical protein [Halorussus halophilus]
MTDDGSDRVETEIDSKPPEDADIPDVPDWDDEYVDRVSDRLMFNYDLEKDYHARGRSFTLYGAMRVESQKQFLHRSINYANHESREHLFVRRVSSVSKPDLESLVEFGHDLADEWIDADEEHYGTDFTFAVVAPEIPADVREFVSGFRDRNLLKYGYYGHYEVNLLVVAPEEEAVVASPNADVSVAFQTWTDVPEPPTQRGLLARLVSRIRG